MRKTKNYFKKTSKLPWEIISKVFTGFLKYMIILELGEIPVLMIHQLSNTQ